jgi:hypothetical protein
MEDCAAFYSFYPRSSILDCSRLTTFQNRLSAVGDITLRREFPLLLPPFRSIEPPQVTENRTPRVGKTRALSKRVRGF